MDNNTPHSKLSNEELNLQNVQLKAQLKECQEELNNAKVFLNLSQKNKQMGSWEVDLIKDE